MSISRFRTFGCSPIGFVSDPGSREKKIYSLKKINGKDTLVVTGVEDIQEKVNVASQSVDLYGIIARSVNDPSVLMRGNVSFRDLTGEPKSLMELFNNNQFIQNQFYQLPEDLRTAFGNSYTEFVKGLQDGRVMQFMTDKVKKGDNGDVQPEQESV